MDYNATVFVVDDDNAIRESLTWILRSMGLGVQSFASPDEVLRGSNPELPGCFLLDLQLPGMNGFELQRRLVQRGCYQPFIMLSGHADIALAVQAMHLGALDFVEKPFTHQRLLDCVQRGVQRDVAQRRVRTTQAEVRARMDLLTDRERQVLELVVAGELSKRIAGQLDISMKTVEVHRSNIMKKLEVNSVAELTGLVTRFALASDDRATA